MIICLFIYLFGWGGGALKLDSHEVSFFVFSCKVVAIWGINMVNIFSYSVMGLSSWLTFLKI